MKGLKPYFEDYHKLKYTNEAIKASVELSARYIHDRKLPDKAIDVIDEAGAAQRILPKSKQKKTITRNEVEEIVAKIARIPPASVSNDDRSKLKSLDRDLKNVVFGQDPAIEALSSAIKMARSGLGKPDRPIGDRLHRLFVTVPGFQRAYRWLIYWEAEATVVTFTRPGLARLGTIGPAGWPGPKPLARARASPDFFRHKKVDPGLL